MRNKKKDKKDEHRKELVQILTVAAKDQKMLDSFLNDLLTKGEYPEIALRWQIAKGLAKRKSYGAIMSELGVGIATVTRGARELSNRAGGFWQVINKLGREDKK